MSRAAVLTTIVLVALTMGPAGAVLSVHDIQPGMRGYGKTVLSGTDITTFDVRVIDVILSNGSVPDLILVKVGGPAIEQVGGICAGMSGSPIYINDSLAGAIGYTTPFADTSYGYVVPIDYLLPLLDWPQETGEAWRSADAGLLDGLIMAQSPLMVSGMPERAFRTLNSRLGDLELRAVQGGATAGFSDGAQTLQPGSSIGIQLTRGDINVTAVGTLTHVDGGRFVAFGHSFIHQGPAAFPLVATKVAAVIPSSELPFKLASPSTRVAGTVLQDRQSGVGGVLGPTPDMIRVTIDVSGEHVAQPMQLSAEVVKDPELTADLVGAAALGALDGLIDRQGVGRAELTCSLTLADGRTVTRSDVVSSDTDISGFVGLEVRDIVATVDQNPFQPAGIASVSVRVRQVRQPGEAAILGATVRPEAVAPGQQAEVRVRVQPFRGPVEEIPITIMVPQGARPGVAHIRVHAKSSAALLEFEAGDAEAHPADFDALLSALPASGLRCAVVCDLVRSPFDDLLGGVGTPALVPVQPQNEGEHDLPQRPAPGFDAASGELFGLFITEARATGLTRYVPSGDLMLPLRILRP